MPGHLAKSLFLLSSAAMLAPDAPAASFKAAPARTDITPPAGVAMWGYARRAGPATGTLDPLFARILLMESDSKRIALVTLDLGRPFGAESIERLRAAASQKAAVSYVFIAASHTHSGPVILDEYRQGARPAWEAAAVDKIAAAIAEAAGRLQDARIGTGYGVAYIGHNRLRINSDGTVTWFERNPTMTPTAPVDPTVSVLRIDAENGKPLAVVVNYACHPVVFGPDNLQFSADFPGQTVKAVEEAFGGEPLCMFLQGAPGDINPLHAVTPLAQDAVKLRDWTGRRLGEEAARVAKTIRTEPAHAAALKYSEDLLTFRLRWNEDKYRKGIIAIFGPKAFEEFAPPIRREMQLPVATVLIDNRIALMGMPGEPFVDFQIDWRNRCPVRDAFFAGYANAYYGYFPTIRAATVKGYGAASVTTWVEPGAGERMVNHALVRIYEMLGQLNDKPFDAPF